MMANSLPFKGRVGVGMGMVCGIKPIPILTFPLKGKGSQLNVLRIENFLMQHNQAGKYLPALVKPKADARRRSSAAFRSVPAAARVVGRCRTADVFCRVGDKRLVTDSRAKIIRLPGMFGFGRSLIRIDFHLAYWIERHFLPPFHHADGCRHP